MFDFKYDGPGPGKGGTGVLTVDGKELARKTIPHTIPLLMSIWKNVLHRLRHADLEKKRSLAGEPSMSLSLC